MSAALMSTSSLNLPRLPGPWAWRNLAAAAVAVGLHTLVLGLLLAQWPSSVPEAPQVRTLTTQLITLAPPAPPPPEVVPPVPAVPEPVQPVEPVVEAPRPDPRLEQQRLEQAALARKRVEDKKREQEQQRLQRERAEQARQEQLARQQEQQRLAAERAEAAERARQAEAAAAASRQYLPIAKEAPDYPERALDKGIEGDCTVSYRVTPQGRVENPQVVGDCHPLFVRPSLAAARSFRYQPRVIDGQAVAVDGVKNTFHYRIE